LQIGNPHIRTFANPQIFFMQQYPLNNILFLDIETVPQFSTYQELPEAWKSLWDLKANYLIRNKADETCETVYCRAGIYAEFGKNRLHQLRIYNGKWRSEKTGG
jgi:hypothetical protein